MICHTRAPPLKATRFCASPSTFSCPPCEMQCGESLKHGLRHGSTQHAVPEENPPQVSQDGDHSGMGCQGTSRSRSDSPSSLGISVPLALFRRWWGTQTGSCFPKLSRSRAMVSDQVFLTPKPWLFLLHQAEERSESQTRSTVGKAVMLSADMIWRVTS